MKKMSNTNNISDINDIIKQANKNGVDVSQVSDGYHTFDELYEYRKLYNAAFFNELVKNGTCKVHKSKRHNTGEECFGGGWFIVMAELPTGQVSNHYELKDWDLFKCGEQEFADKWDGHTPEEAAKRIKMYLTGNYKVKFAGKLYDVVKTKCEFGVMSYMIEDEPNHYDWLNDVEIVYGE